MLERGHGLLPPVRQLSHPVWPAVPFSVNGDEDMTKTSIPVTRDKAPKEARTPAPWGGFGNLREEMERLFDAFEPRAWFDRDAPALGLSPAIDLVENADTFTITTELPGLAPEDVSVKIANGTLTISGEKSEEKKEDEGETWHMRERRWGRFQRSIRMPDSVDRDKVDAQFAKGVLTVTMPKSKEAKASERDVAIKAA
jgi:HSP20 family protein